MTAAATAERPRTERPPRKTKTTTDDATERRKALEVDDQTAFAIETLKGDIRDRLLEYIKGLDTPWSKMTENQQKRCIENVGVFSGSFVLDAVTLIATREFDHIEVKLGDMKISAKGIEMKLTTPGSLEDLETLYRRNNQLLCLVPVAPNEFMGERKPAEPDVIGDLKLPKTDKQVQREADAKEAGADKATGELPPPPTEQPPTAQPEQGASAPPAPATIGDQAPTHSESAGQG